MTARAHPEDDFHVSLADLLTYGIAPPGVLSREGVLWVSHENRDTGRKVKRASGAVFSPEGVQRKRRGVIAGVPDMQFVFNGRSYWIELKAKRGATSDRQDALHAALRSAGCCVAVARDLGQVVAVLTRWGVPHRIGAA